MTDEFGPDYPMAEHLLGATAYGYLEDDFDEVNDMTEQGFWFRLRLKILRVFGLKDK